MDNGNEFCRKATSNVVSRELEVNQVVMAKDVVMK